MTRVTVEDLLRLIPSERLRLVGGQAGLAREAHWATALRATPPYLSHLNGGELVLLLTGTLRSISPPLNPSQLIGALAERGAAAAIVDSLSTEAIDAAERHRLPLLLTAPGAATELESELNRLINERLNHLYTVASGAGRRFAELAVSGGLAGILEHTATLLEKLVLWEDEHYVTLMAVPPPGQALAFPPPQPPPMGWPTRSANGRHETNLPVALPPGPDGYRRLAAPVLTNGALRGYLSAVVREGELTDVDRVVIQRAAEVCAFELLRSPTQRREEATAVETLLAELVHGHYTSEAALLGRARYLGLSLEQPHLVVAIDLREAAADRRREELARLVGLELRGRLNDALMVRGLSSAVLLLIPLAEAAGEAERLRRSLDELARRLTQRLTEDETVAIGLSQCRTGPTGYGTAYREALFALRIGSVVALEPPVSFDRLGFYRLLFTLNQGHELTNFRDDILGTLLDYDRRRSSEMITTLEAYFNSGCNVVDAADQLHVHRNSLAYRLRRISEITERDLHDQEHLFVLQLALKVHRVIEALPPPPAVR